MLYFRRLLFLIMSSFVLGQVLGNVYSELALAETEVNESALNDIALALYITNPRTYVKPLLKAIEKTEVLNQSRHFELALGLARVYLELNQLEDAKYYFALADALVSQQNDPIKNLKVTVTRSAILEKVKDRKAAFELLKQSEMGLTRAGLKLTGYWQSRLASLTAAEGDFEDAKDRFQRLIQFYSLNKMKTEEAYSRTIYVNKLLMAGIYDQASLELAAANILSEQLGDPKVARYVNLARARLFLRTGKYQDAASIYFNELEWAESVGSKVDVAFAAMALGVVFDELEEYEQSESFYLRAKPLYVELNDKEGIAVILYNLATITLRLNKLEAAEKYFLELIDFSRKNSDTYYVAFGFIGLANIHILSEQIDKALSYLEQAKLYLKDDTRPDTKVNLYLAFGLAYSADRQFNEAERNLKRAYDITKKNDMVNFNIIVVQYLVDLYTKSENWREASTFESELADLKKKVFDQNKAQAIAEVAAKYEEDKKAQEIEILSKDNALKAAELSRQESDKQLFIGLALATLIVVLAFITRYFNLQTKRKTRLYDKAFNTSAEAMWVTTPDLKIVVANPAYSEITGKPAKSLVGSELVIHEPENEPGLLKKIVSIAQQDGHWQGEIYDKKVDGTIYPIDFQLHPLYNDNNRITHYFGVFEDITERYNAKKELEHLATHDSLTGIPNRTLFTELLQRACERADETECFPVVLVIDLDNFKLVNDSYGHEVGDNLLMIVSQKLQGLLQADQVLARIGGDEFCIFLCSASPADDGAHLAQRITNELATNIDFQGKALAPTASIGLAVYPDDGNNSTALMRNADIAMYAVKDRSKNGFYFYETGMNERIVAALEMEERIKIGLSKNQFELYFQPRVGVANGQIVGAEALIRWPQVDGSMIFPDQFIPIAEKTQLIIEIDRYVIEQALIQISSWIKEGVEPGLVSINLSAPHFGRPEALLPFLEDMLEKYDVHEKNLEIEITESMLLQHVDKAVATMEAIRALGISLAVDDFGTGYSSLSYIQRFPLNVLKIDRTFIKNMHLSGKDQSVTKAIIKLAQSLQLRVVAEGVEEAEHLSILASLGCDEYQGYYFSRPIPADEFGSLRENHKGSKVS